MKIIELLLEYNRTITQQRFGPQIINAARQDKQWLMHLKDTPDDKLINLVLMLIEDQDPTTNKEYTQWMVRLFVTGNLNITEVDPMLLQAHWIGKRRKMIKNPQLLDINTIKSYPAFESMMNKEDIETILTPKQIDKGDADKVYEDNQVRIIIPHDETAACYYGLATKWCTAASKSENEFDNYNEDGTLFILLPRQRMYTREKYQIYIDDNVGMIEAKNDKDKNVSQTELLKNRFPGALEFFQNNYPNSINNVTLMTDEILYDKVTDVRNKIWNFRTSDRDITAKNIIDLSELLNVDHPTKWESFRNYIDQFNTDTIITTALAMYVKDITKDQNVVKTMNWLKMALERYYAYV